MANDKKSKTPLIIAVALLVIGGGLAAFFMLKGDGRSNPPTMFVNGFDFAVKIKAAPEGPGPQVQGGLPSHPGHVQDRAAGGQGEEGLPAQHQGDVPRRGVVIARLAA